MKTRESARRMPKSFEGFTDIKLLRELARALFNEADSLMILFDPRGTIVEANRAALELLGRSREDLRDMNIYTDLIAEPHSAEMERICLSVKPEKVTPVTCSLRRADGESVSEHLSLSLLNEGSSPVLLFTGITPRKNASETDRRDKSPLRDPVTGLPTPAFFHEELQHVDSEQNLPISVIRADLDGMKLINSIYGESAGDRLMRAAARVLRKHSRNSYILIRWEEDEFLLLLPRTREEDAAFIVDRIEDAFNSAKLRDIPVSPSISLGFAAKSHRWQKFDNALLDAEEDMREEQLSKDKKIHTKILSKLLKLLDEHTPETEEHADSMLRIARRLGALKGLGEEEMQRLNLAVRFHDIGKAPIPWGLQNKTAPITDDERALLYSHAEKGYEIAMAATPELAETAPIILSHHERWDGTGYPRGLAGKDIPLLSRIIAIADAFDVMTRGTPYRDPMSAEEALNEIKKLSGQQFDPELASLLTKHADF